MRLYNIEMALLILLNVTIWEQYCTKVSVLIALPMQIEFFSVEEILNLKNCYS